MEVPGRRAKGRRLALRHVEGEGGAMNGVAVPAADRLKGVTGVARSPSGPA